MNDEAVFRTAPAIPGPPITFYLASIDPGVLGLIDTSQLTMREV